MYSGEQFSNNYITHKIDTFLIDVNDNKYISGVNTQCELKELEKQKPLSSPDILSI
jgi:hypothetical protein